MEAHDIDKTDRSSGPKSWHPYDVNHPETFVYMHMPIVELESATRGYAVRAHGGHH